MNAPITALPISFYARDAETVARALLGTILVFHDKRLRVVETEAYVGTHDLACHASKGRTARTEVLFGPPGRAYLYLIYGMYELFNVVTGEDGDAQGVLVRAGEPLANITGKTDGPDLELLSALVAAVSAPIVAEGRFDSPDLVAEAFRRGAHAVVVGTAITNPREITRKFVRALPKGTAKDSL